MINREDLSLEFENLLLDVHLPELELANALLDFRILMSRLRSHGLPHSKNILSPLPKTTTTEQIQATERLGFATLKTLQTRQRIVGTVLDNSDDLKYVAVVIDIDGRRQNRGRLFDGLS
jgi:hypothetical protein